MGNYCLVFARTWCVVRYLDVFFLVNAILPPAVSDPNQTNKRAFIDFLVLVEIVEFGLECVVGGNDLTLGAIYHTYDISAAEDIAHELLCLLSFLCSFRPGKSLLTAFLLDRRIDQDQSKSVS